MENVIFLLAAALLGLIPAFIASGKGRSFMKWWLFGFLLFIVALVCSIVIKPSHAIAEEEQLALGMKRCPFCAELVQGAAVVCKHCGRDVPIEPAQSIAQPVPYQGPLG